MSVTFWIVGDVPPCRCGHAEEMHGEDHEDRRCRAADGCSCPWFEADRQHNMCNASAAAILRPIGLDPVGGEMRAGALADLLADARARGSFAAEAYEAHVDEAPGRSTVYTSAMPLSRIVRNVEGILAVCDVAGDLGVISWG